MTDHLPAITGLILAGGRGSRMGGVDKGLQLLDGRPLVEHALERLRRQAGERLAGCLVNANRNLDVYRALGVPVWPDPGTGPAAFPGPLGVSLIGTAWREAALWTLETVDIRGFSKDKRGFLDDTPAGGGPGQVMRADVIASALDSIDSIGSVTLCDWSIM